MKLNQHYRMLEESYLFSTVNAKVKAYQEQHPDQQVLRLGIGDVTQPLPPLIVDAFLEGVRDQGDPSRFHGYGPEQGYSFLRSSIQKYYQHFNVELDSEDVFISDGAKSDLGNILDLFDQDNTVLIPDPVYPVYRDTNQMAGRRISYMAANLENDFLPLPDETQQADLIYLCSPNNPTGAVYNRRQLKKWVDYAISQEAILLFDAAYEAFVNDSELPHSIYEIPGAEQCAIEFCSLSKTAGFTGTRCGYTIVPQQLMREGMQLRKMWLRRQTTKFNGVSYPVQRAAAAAFTQEGILACQKLISYYRKNSLTIAKTLKRMDIPFVGGDHSPYLWLQCPGKMNSWQFFDDLLMRAQVVGTPGCGFGANGEGFFRLTAFGTYETTCEAMRRVEYIYG